MRSLFVLPLVFTLFSCGPSSDYVNVSVITPFGMKNKFHNLSEEIFNVSGASHLLNPNYCEQGEIRIGTNETVGDHRVFTKKIKILSDTTSSCSISASECIIDHSIIPEPIVIQVKKGQPVEFGILGAYYSPVDTFPSDGICDTAVSPSQGNSNYSLIGHQEVNLSSPTTITLPIWVVESYPITSLGSNSMPNCGDDFIQIAVNNNNCSFLHLMNVEYFEDKISQKAVQQSLDSLASPNNGTGLYNHYIPSFFPMKLTYKNNLNINTTVIIDDVTWSYIGGPGCSIALQSMGN